LKLCTKGRGKVIVCLSPSQDLIFR
jgi:hypothetical protein